MEKIAMESAEQESFNFEKIHDVRCFDNARGFGKEVFIQDLTSVGDDRYIDEKGNVYESAIKKHPEDPDQYTLVKRIAN
jgi:hypothetical protein